MERAWFRHWPDNMPQSMEYPEIPLDQILTNSATRSPDQPAIAYLNSEMTYPELNLLVTKFAEAFRRLGVMKGDRVAIYLPNIPQFTIAYYGALRANAIVVPISSLYKERELERILSDSGAPIIVALEGLYPRVQAARASSKLLHVITTRLDENLSRASVKTNPSEDVNSKTCSDALDMKSLLIKHEGITQNSEVDPRNDVAVLQYTGGTTGTPKGAMLTHRNLIANALQFATWLGFRQDDVHLCSLPFFHIYGMTVAMNAPTFSKSKMILIPDPRDINRILSTIETQKPTVFCGVPATYIALINQPEIGKRNLRSIRVCVSGGTSLPTEVQRRFESLTGGRLVEGYGLTEASPVTHVNPLDEPSKNRPGSIGIPIIDTHARIIDLEEDEKELPPGALGELVVSGPQVMKGYWNNVAETGVAFHKGWLHTGDIATMDQDGYFRILDRKSDVINVSGFKVWPREVEEVLYEHPSVKEAAVTSVPDSVSGEAVKAFIVLKDGVSASDEELSKFCKDRLAPYKAPKIIEFRDTLPKTPVGKILKRELKTT